MISPMTNTCVFNTVVPNLFVTAMIFLAFV